MEDFEWVSLASFGAECVRLVAEEGEGGDEGTLGFQERRERFGVEVGS